MKRLRETALVIGIMGGLTVIMWGAVAMTTSDASPVPSPTPTATQYVNVPIPVPGPTVTVKPKPAPTKTIYVTRSPQVSRAEERTAPTSKGNLWAGATGIWDGQSALYVNRAICIVQHESWHSGTYTAENPTSSASGVGQWIDSTWLAHAKYAGIKVVPHASNNSPTVQDRVLVYAVHHLMYAWSWSC